MSVEELPQDNTSQDLDTINGSELITELPSTSSRVLETADTVSSLTETDIQSPEQATSLKNSFLQAWETVRNSDPVLNIIDHAKVWWYGTKGIDADIARLEQLQKTQDQKASKYTERISKSDASRTVLSALRKDLKMNEVGRSHADIRNRKIDGLNARAESHRSAGEAIRRELDQKKRLKTEYEQIRENSIGNIAERFENKISENETRIQTVGIAVDEIAENLKVADGIVQSLQEKKEIAERIANAPDALLGDRNNAREFVIDTESRIQNMRREMQKQEQEVARHSEKKSALTTQLEKWQKTIQKDAAPEQQQLNPVNAVSDEEKVDSFAEETEEGLDKADADKVDDESVAKQEKDPRVALLEQFQEIMGTDDFKMYAEENYRSFVEQDGSSEQKALLRQHDLIVSLFAFIETPQKRTSESALIETKQAGENSLDKWKKEYDGLVDSVQEDSDIAGLFDSKNQNNILEGQGTKQENFLVQLIMFLEAIFKPVEGRKSKNPL